MIVTLHIGWSQWLRQAFFVPFEKNSRKRKIKNNLKLKQETQGFSKILER